MPSQSQAAPRWIVAVTLATSACSDLEPGDHFVSPFDGQTDWPADAPLQVHLGQPVAPEGADLDPYLVTVVDLDVGGRVEGDLAAQDGDLWFFPTEPFPAGHRFAWSVAPPHDEARSVHLAIPTELTGSATFSTSPLAEPVAALRLDDDICLVWSRPPPGDGEPALAAGLVVLADGRRVAVEPASEVALTGIEPRTAGAASLGCLALDDAGIDAATIEGVRVSASEQVWQLPVQARSTDDLLAERHRFGAGSSSAEEGS